MRKSAQEKADQTELRTERDLLTLERAKGSKRPIEGWIAKVRRLRSVSREELGIRMALSRQGVGTLERSEKRGVITLARMEAAAKALDCELVYYFVPSDRYKTDLLGKTLIPLIDLEIKGQLRSLVDSIGGDQFGKSLQLRKANLKQPLTQFIQRLIDASPPEER